MSLFEVIRKTTSRAGVVRVSNALNPLLWACALAPIAWVFAYVFQADPIMKLGFFALDALPIICSMIACFVLLAIDRDRLQSEAFVLRQQELAIIHRKLGPPIPFGPDVSTEPPRSGNNPNDQGAGL